MIYKVKRHRAEAIRNMMMDRCYIMMSVIVLTVVSIMYSTVSMYWGSCCYSKGTSWSYGNIGIGYNKSQ